MTHHPAPPPDPDRDATLAKFRSDWGPAISSLSERLATTFDPLVSLSRSGSHWLSARPEPKGWTGAEVLEHVASTNHYLLRLVQKIGDKAMKRASRGDLWPTAAPRFDQLEAIASRKHTWPHPEHMAPSGPADLSETAQQLERDLAAAHDWLRRLPRGEGTLHRIRMSVVGDAGADEDRLDLYQFLSVIELHARRHRGQLDRLQKATESPGATP